MRGGSRAHLVHRSTVLWLLQIDALFAIAKGVSYLARLVAELSKLVPSNESFILIGVGGQHLSYKDSFQHSLSIPHAPRATHASHHITGVAGATQGSAPA